MPSVGELADRLARHREAIRLRPDSAAAHTALAGILFAQRRYSEAERCCRMALRLRPRSAELNSNLAAVLIRLGRLKEAETYGRAALEIDPANAGAYNNLGNALEGLGSLEEAEAYYRRGLRIEPQNCGLLVSLGNTLRAQLRLEEALERFEGALRLDPANAAAHLNRGLVLLLAGRWEEGWREYEWRRGTEECVPRYFQPPEWDGSPLNGRRILLYAEQGLGDTLQFLRYVPLVERAGGRVLLQCDARLGGLPETVGGTAAGPHCSAFDVQAPLLSLPRIFGTTPGNVPAGVPYLAADAELLAQWGQALGSCQGFKIGIACSGNPNHKGDRSRSIPPEYFAPLAKLPGVRLYNLGLTPVGGWCDLEGCKTIPGTAAVVSHLDLVISADTMVAHLAGALARPVWLLLPFAPDFRWLLDREDTPWYPTMRLFRQPARGDWASVIDRVAAALKNAQHS